MPPMYALEQGEGTCLMKISRRRLCPNGLYFRLKRSKRWKVFLSACMSSVSTFRSYLVPHHPVRNPAGQKGYNSG